MRTKISKALNGQYIVLTKLGWFAPWQVVRWCNSNKWCLWDTFDEAKEFADELKEDDKNFQL